MALRFFVQNVPQNLRDLARVSAPQPDRCRRAKKSRLDDPEIDGAFLESLRQEMKASINVLINQSDQITVGWAVDTQGGRDVCRPAGHGRRPVPRWRSNGRDCSQWPLGLHRDSSWTMRPPHSRVWRSFSPDRPERSARSWSISARSRSRESRRIPSAPAALKDIVNGVLDVVDRTVQEGASEIAASVVLAPKSFRFVAGVHVADGRALADAFQKLYELAKQQPDVPEVKFFADKHRDIDLHTLTVPISERDEDSARCSARRTGRGRRHGSAEPVFCTG